MPLLELWLQLLLANNCTVDLSDWQAADAVRDRNSECHIPQWTLV